MALQPLHSHKQKHTKTRTHPITLQCQCQYFGSCQYQAHGSALCRRQLISCLPSTIPPPHIHTDTHKHKHASSGLSLGWSWAELNHTLRWWMPPRSRKVRDTGISYGAVPQVLVVVASPDHTYSKCWWLHIQHLSRKYNIKEGQRKRKRLNINVNFLYKYY